MGHNLTWEQDPKTEPQTGEASSLLTQALGRRIRVLRAEHGWSQETLSALTGLHRTYLSQVERGSLHISVVQLAKIAHAFDLRVGVLIDGSGVPGAPGPKD
ncbi:MAG: helix-turn-helix domain-containing protein [Acidiferrobacteraceae bacterium]